MRSEDYWKKRSEELLDDVLEDGEKLIKKLKKAYSKAEKAVEDDINILIGKYMQQTGLGYEAANKLLNNKELYHWRMEIGGYLKEIEDALGANKTALQLELDTLAMQARVSAKDALKTQIKGRIGALAAYEDKELTETLSKSFKDTYLKDLYHAHTAGIILDINDDMLGILSDTWVRSKLKIPFKGKNYSERIWKRSWNVADKIDEIVSSSLNTGRSIERLKNDLKKDIAKEATEPLRTAFDVDVERLVRTEIAYAKNLADIESYKMAGIKKYKFIATLDHKTSSKCRGNDNKVFEVEDALIGSNFPPLHPRCRSTTIGLSKYDFEDDMRISRDKHGKNVQVPADMSYDEWYKKYVKTDPEYLFVEKAHAHRASDKKQHAKYKGLLKKEVPNSLVGFQRLKYTEPKKWDTLKLKYKDESLRKDILENYNLSVLDGRQGKHVKGHNNYEGKSYVLDDVDIEKLVKKYAGTGKIRRTKGRWIKKTFHKHDRNIGVDVSSDGKESLTSRFSISYSKSDGVHIVPREEKPNGK